MKNAVYEPHNMPDIHLPFIFHTDTMRSGYSYSNWHDNPEFLFCLEGKGFVMCNSKRIEFSKGDTIIINPKVLHSVSAPEFVTYRCLIINQSFLEESSIPVDSFYFFDSMHDAEAGLLMEKVAANYSGTKDGWRSAKIRLSILNYLMYICSHYAVPVKTEVMSGKSKSFTAVRDAVEYINDNFSSKLTLEEIASKVGFSKYHFARIFRENTGYTLVEHINACRCEQAKHYLCETDYTISQICALCGFENASYFSKTFRNYSGLLPSQYRKDNRGGSSLLVY